MKLQANSHTDLTLLIFIKDGKEFYFDITDVEYYLTEDGIDLDTFELSKAVYYDEQDEELTRQFTSDEKESIKALWLKKFSQEIEDEYIKHGFDDFDDNSKAMEFEKPRY